MPISSFYGMQTSLRGLIAQQRMLDTTSHNIANASTTGYSRQEATLAASTALHGADRVGRRRRSASSAPASMSPATRRIRDNFLDAQYRGQNTSLQEQTARSGALEHR